MENSTPDILFILFQILIVIMHMLTPLLCSYINYRNCKKSMSIDTTKMFIETLSKDNFKKLTSVLLYLNPPPKKGKVSSNGYGALL